MAFRKTAFRAHRETLPDACQNCPILCLCCRGFERTPCVCTIQCLTRDAAKNAVEYGASSPYLLCAIMTLLVGGFPAMPGIFWAKH